MRKLLALVLLIPILLIMSVTVKAEEPTTLVEIAPSYDWYNNSTIDSETGVTTYTISNVADLAGLAKITQGNVTVDASTTITKSNFANCIVKLGADLTFAAGEYWYYNDNAGTVYDYRILDFAGTFDGGGHTITGLNIYCAKTNTSGMGLFSKITGSVCGLTLDTVTGGFADGNQFGFIAANLTGAATNCHVSNVTFTSARRVYGSSMMFGYVTGGTVTECTVDTVNGTWSGDDNTDQVGALIGRANNGATVSNCSVKDITFECTKKTKQLGGFVGRTDSATISNCTATNVNFTIDTYYQEVGGFVGIASNSTFTDCNMIGCTMSGNLTGGSTSGEMGGFVGETSGTVGISGCSVTGLSMNVICNDTNSWRAAGGLVGYQGGTVTIESSDVSGTITATGNSTTVNPVGGLVGKASGSAITVTDSTAAGVTIEAAGPAGGLVGEVNSTTPVTITNSTAAGSVTTTGAAGGIVGYIVEGADKVTITNSTPSTNVSGVITDPVANAPDKDYSYNSADKTVSTVPYPCYVTESGIKIGYLSIQAAVDAGADSVTLLIDTELGKPTKSGYKLEGWYENDGFTGGAVTTGSSGKTYYPKWTAVYVPSTNELAFGSLKVGYTTTTAKEIIFTYDGTPVDIKAVVSDAGANTAFDVAIDGRKVTVTPKSGLAKGTYTETLTITTGDDDTHQVTVTLTVISYGGGGGNITIQSPKTFDGGIALYVGMALSSALGAAYVSKEK